MGSVRSLYTTGDNDPEIEPVQYDRHYLYCDACGSFKLTPWAGPNEREKAQRIETLRHWLGIEALMISPFVLVALWAVLGFVLSPAVLVALAAAVVIAPALHGLVSQESAAKRWRFVKWALLAIPLLWVADGLLDDVLSPKVMLIGGALLLVGSLVARVVVASNFEYLGFRCETCDATYAYGTPFFTDLDANPRQLTVADVPRPLGSSAFLRGRSHESTPSPSSPPS